jgi:RHS repeat-associated protein
LENYNYDGSTGNLSSKGGVSYTYNAQVNCTAGNRTIPHAVSGAGGNTYAYDCNGNQVTRTIGGSTYNLTYDAENRMTAVSGGTTASFVYDGDGQRVKGTVSGATTTYIHNYFEWTGSTSSMKKYYYDGAARVAMRTGNSTLPTTGLNWLFGDHLGSTSITADSGGNRSGELRYKGWGENRYSWGTTPTTYQFTGQRNESTLGLYFYNSRWFDPALGRFIQADPVVPSLTNSQALDRYAYVLNNPTNNVDPSGYKPCNNMDAVGRCELESGWNSQTHFVRPAMGILGHRLEYWELVMIALAVLRETGMGSYPYTAIEMIAWIYFNRVVRGYGSVWGALRGSNSAFSCYPYGCQGKEPVWNPKDPQSGNLLLPPNPSREQIKEYVYALLKWLRKYHNDEYKDLVRVYTIVSKIYNDWLEYGSGSNKDPTYGATDFVQYHSKEGEKGFDNGIATNDRYIRQGLTTFYIIYDQFNANGLTIWLIFNDLTAH